MKSICLAVACLIITSVAAADTINVPAGGDIQAAINGASDGDIIQLEAGEYFPAATIDTLGKEVSIIGASHPKTGAPSSIIDGQDSIRVLQCTSGEDADTVFENLLITGGYTSGSGGGMYNTSSNPTLTGCTFEGNSAAWHGGGMYNVDNSSPTLSDCMFAGNSSSDQGGGMYNDDSSSPVLANCTFTNNSASDGGGMLNYSSPALENCTFEGNSADDRGGGMFNWNSSPTLSDCTFASNSAISYGGGIYNNSSSNPTLTDTTVCGNTPDQIDGNWTDNGGNTVEENCEEYCLGDLNNDAEVNGADLAAVLGAWGTAEQSADLNGDGNVDGADLAMVLGAWGACP